MPEELGVAVLGGGYWGGKLIRHLSAAEGWDLRWVCDSVPGRARAALGARTCVAATEALEDVLADDRVHAVVVATPAESHRTLSMRVLAAGRHVLVEKPIASSLLDAEAMVEFANAGDLALMCDHTYCYTRSARTIRALVRGGRIGRVRSVDSVRDLGVVRPDVDVFWDLAPHDLSILDFILPAESVPTGVTAQGDDPIGAGKACSGQLTVSLSCGGVARAHVDWLSQTKVRRTVIHGSRGRIVWDDLDDDERVRIYDGHGRRASAHARSARREPSEPEPLTAVLEEFRRAIVDRRAPLTDGPAALRVVRILDAASQSLQNEGRLVELQWLP